MTPEIWQAKKVVDSTLHPGNILPKLCSHCLRLTLTDTGQPVFLPFRMSCFVISNLIVTAGMLTPGLQVFHPLNIPQSPNANEKTDNRHPTLANNQSIPQRRHQQRQRKQINPPLDLQNSSILPPRRLSLLLRRPRPECCGAPPETGLSSHKNSLDAPCTICSRCVSRRT